MVLVSSALDSVADIYQYLECFKWCGSEEAADLFGYHSEDAVLIPLERCGTLQTPHSLSGLLEAEHVEIDTIQNLPPITSSDNQEHSNI